MKTAVVATKCFKDFQIISWHLMDMVISELVVSNNEQIYSCLKKYSENNHNIPIQHIEMSISTKAGYLAKNDLLLESCDRLVVFWNGRHTGIAALIRHARELEKEVSVVFSYPTSIRRMIKAC